MNRLTLSAFVAVSLMTTAVTVDASQKRSQTAKNHFKVAHPCPANGKTKGSCPGYVIDHINPLACGGPDAPINMQWQTIAAGKAKDRWERNPCR